MDELSFRSAAGPVRAWLCAALLLVGCSAPAWSEPVYICTFDELIACIEGLGCSKDRRAKLQMPRQIKVDIAGRKISSLEKVRNLQEGKVQNLQKRDGGYFFQAIQKSRPAGKTIIGWTVFINPKSRKLSGSAVIEEVVVNAFGSCEQQGG